MEFLTDPFLVPAGSVEGPVLVTGAGGCIGSWTVAILARSGVPVVACDLGDDRRRNALLMGEAGAAALTWERCDITEAAALEEIVRRHGIRAVIHLAGLQIPFCKAKPALGARVNVEGTINVFEVARAQELRRLAYASSTAAHGMPPGGPVIATLYGAYKVANEHCAKVYSLDWGVHSVGIRPNVVYGVGRDQGLTSGFTVGIAKAVLGEAYEVPYTGAASFLYAGEAAAAFIAAVSRDAEGAPVFDHNGGTETIENGLALLDEILPGHRVTAAGGPLPIAPDYDDGPLRAHLGDFPRVPPAEGIRRTAQAFAELAAAGRLRATA